MAAPARLAKTTANLTASSAEKRPARRGPAVAARGAACQGRGGGCTPRAGVGGGGVLIPGLSPPAPKKEGNPRAAQSAPRSSAPPLPGLLRASGNGAAQAQSGARPIA